MLSYLLSPIAARGSKHGKLRCSALGTMIAPATRTAAMVACRNRATFSATWTACIQAASMPFQSALSPAVSSAIAALMKQATSDETGNVQARAAARSLCGAPTQKASDPQTRRRLCRVQRQVMYLASAADTASIFKHICAWGREGMVSLACCSSCALSLCFLTSSASRTIWTFSIFPRIIACRPGKIASGEARRLAVHGGCLRGDGMSWSSGGFEKSRSIV